MRHGLRVESIDSPDLAGVVPKKDIAHRTGAAWVAEKPGRTSDASCGAALQQSRG